MSSFVDAAVPVSGLAQIPRTVFVTTGLLRGGAEAMLFKLVSGMSAVEDRGLVVSLRERAPLAAAIEATGARVLSLGLRPNPTGLRAFWRLGRAIRAYDAELLQGWMYHGNLAALFGRVLARCSAPLLWSIRTSISELAAQRRQTAQLVRLGARLSSYPQKIIYNSRTAARQHEAIGYDPSRTVVIPNGFDTERFRPDESARRRERAALGIHEATTLIGLVGRYHRVKDHPGFLRAAHMLLAEGLDVAFVLAGRGVTRDEPLIAEALRGFSDSELRRVQFLPELSDVAPLTKAFDVACSTSRMEAFPNVVGEAMAAGVPCVVTDVGDSAWVVGGAGAVVPPGDTRSLASALRQLVTAGAENRRRLGLEARARVQANFDIRYVIGRYAAVYNEAVRTEPCPSGA